MINQTYYNKLVHNAEKIILKIKKLEKNGFEKNKDKIALLNLSLYQLIKEMEKHIN